MPAVAVDQEARDLAAGAAKLPWSRLLTARGTKLMLSKPFAIRIWNGSGHDHVVDLRGRFSA